RDFHVTGVQTCALPIYARATRHAAFRFVSTTKSQSSSCVFANSPDLATPALLIRISMGPKNLPASSKAFLTLSLSVTSIATAARSEERRVGKEREPRSG